MATRSVSDWVCRRRLPTNDASAMVRRRRCVHHKDGRSQCRGTATCKPHRGARSPSRGRSPRLATQNTPSVSRASGDIVHRTVFDHQQCRPVEAHAQMIRGDFQGLTPHGYGYVAAPRVTQEQIVVNRKRHAHHNRDKRRCSERGVW
jgi:hypothetical protein